MTAIDNRTPFAVAGQFVRDEVGRSFWAVVTRATFSFADGPIQLTEEQTPVYRSPEYFERDGELTLRFDSDFHPPRKATDFLIHAHARTPAGRALPELEVGFEIGPYCKRLTVTGPRFFEPGVAGLAISNPQVFSQAAIDYTQAWGGVSYAHTENWSNPIGRGLPPVKDNLLGTRAPSVFQREAAGNEIQRVAGFGPIPESWLPRAQFAGTQDEHWLNARFPRMPPDFHPAYYQAAPSDQQFEPRLVGGERLSLFGFTEEPCLTLVLPRPLFRSTGLIRGRLVEALTLLETVVVLVEARRLVLVWSNHWAAVETEVAGTRVEAEAWP